MTLRAVGPGTRCRETRVWRCGSAQPIGHCRQDGDGAEPDIASASATEQGLVGEEFATSGPDEARVGAGRGDTDRSTASPTDDGGARPAEHYRAPQPTTAPRRISDDG
jgi:hypothetical protein